MGHQSYVLLCTETTVSNPPVVFPTSSCNVHLFRDPWFMSLSLPKLHCHVKAAEGWQNTSANKKRISFHCDDILFTVYMKIATFFLHYLYRCITQGFSCEVNIKQKLKSVQYSIWRIKSAYFKLKKKHFL